MSSGRHTTIQSSGLSYRNVVKALKNVNLQYQRGFNRRLIVHWATATLTTHVHIHTMCPKQLSHTQTALPKPHGPQTADRPLSCPEVSDLHSPICFNRGRWVNIA